MIGMPRLNKYLSRSLDGDEHLPTFAIQTVIHHDGSMNSDTITRKSLSRHLKHMTKKSNLLHSERHQKSLIISSQPKCARKRFVARKSIINHWNNQSQAKMPFGWPLIHSLLHSKTLKYDKRIIFESIKKKADFEHTYGCISIKFNAHKWISGRRLIVSLVSFF